jgi:transcriptional regulator
MYIPRTFAEPDTNALHAFIHAHPFATLVTSGGGLFATHLPLVLRPGDGPLGTLEGHVARANPHHERAQSGSEALVIFAGPHAHITPEWYPSKQRDGRVVPTWNYVAVHAWGCVRFTEDEEFLRPHLAQLTERHESERGSAWRITDPPADYVTKQLGAIVGVEIVIERLEGKWKMSQNRSAEDAAGVVDGLRRTSEPSDEEVARIVEARGRG